MVPLRILRVLGVLFGVSMVLAAVDELVIWTGMPPSMRVLANGLSTAAIVFVLIYRGGWVIRYAMNRPTKDRTYHLRARAALKQVVGSIRPPRLTIYSSERPAAVTANDGSKCCIFVSTGLIDSLSPASLSAVMAHECGHIMEKHPIRQAIILGLLAGVKMSIGIPAAAVVPIVLAYLMMLRDWEYIADRFAFHRVGCATMIEAFGEYRAVTGFESSNPLVDLLSTHPSIRYRVAALREYAAAGGNLQVPWWRSYIPKTPRPRAGLKASEVFQCPEAKSEEH